MGFDFGAALSGFARAASTALDPDRALQLATGGLIELVARKHALGQSTQWREGEPLRLLLAGYSGTRNTGGDVRVEEMIRQFRHLFGDDNVELSLMTYDPKWSAGYFRRVRQVAMPVVFPQFLYQECPRHHGVVACEGSMFKSKFADALSTMMAGSLGMAAAEGKLAVGYGGEAGTMNPGLESFVRSHCRDALVICRNRPSQTILSRLDIRTTAGTDTAWTFESGPPERGERLLREAGWDGETPVLAICPINPFWWPVKPDLAKSLAHKVAGQYADEHYKSVYFHHASREATAKWDRYLAGIAGAVSTFARENAVFPILVGMEKLDRRSAERMAPLLIEQGVVGPRGEGPPLFISDTYDMYELVSVIRRCSMLVSSRYHAIVCSMPGLVPSAGITMDERIRNLMNDRGHPDLFLEVDDPDLEDRLLTILHTLHGQSERVREGIARTLPVQLSLMGQMGIDFLDEVRRVYPALPLPERARSWETHLPPLSPTLDRLCAQYPPPTPQSFPLL